VLEAPTPPELAADIVDRGIVPPGGGSALRNLGRLLRRRDRAAGHGFRLAECAVVLGHRGWSTSWPCSRKSRCKVRRFEWNRLLGRPYILLRCAPRNAPVGAPTEDRGLVIIHAAFLTPLSAFARSAKAPEYLSPGPRTCCPHALAVAHGPAGPQHRSRRWPVVDLVHVRAENETLRNDNNRLRAELLEAKRAPPKSVRSRDCRPAQRRDRGNWWGVIAIDVSPTSAWHASSWTAVRAWSAEACHHHTRRCGGSDSTASRVIPRTSCFSVDPRPPSTWCCRGLAVAAFCAASPARMATAAPSNTSCRASSPRRRLVVTSGMGGFPRDLPVGKISKVTRNAGRDVAGSGGFARRGLCATFRSAGGGGAGATRDPEAGAHKALSPSHGLGVYR